MLRFPEPVEIPLENPPLVEVICQIRFPVVLRISTEPPVAFQEAVRAEFPLLEIQQEFTIPINPSMASVQMNTSDLRSYRFKSMDEQMVITLGPSSLAIATNAYNGWNDFVAKIELAFNAAVQIYSLRSATRIGLRYVNHLTAQNTGINAPHEVWEMLRPELTALWRSEPWQVPSQAIQQLLLDADDQEWLNLRVGYRNEEPVCVLDFDAYAESNYLTLDDLQERVERFHRRIYAAFRWCIPEEKLDTFNSIFF